jgi:hypothetical protein
MANLNVSGTFKTPKATYNAKLSLLSFNEDETVIIYAPALDLSAYGYDIEDAKKSFAIALEEFFRYTVNKNTLLPELKKLGWQIKGGKKHPKITAPDFTTLLNENKTLEDIIENKEFQKFYQNVQIPQFA